MGKVR